MIWNFKQFGKHQWYYIVIAGFYIVLTVCSLHIPFFWDNVLLVSKVAQFYYDYNFDSLILPTDIDTGHPPCYGWYMAIVWQLFGKTLAASHWAVLPFLLGVGICYYHLARYFLPSTLLPFAMVLLFLEPTLLAQSVLGGIDVAMVFAYLLAINCLLYQKRSWLLAMALCLLAAISLRGIIGVFLLFVCDVILHYLRGSKWNWKQLITFIWPYLFTGFFIVIWYAYHYQQAGFLVFNHQAAWAVDYNYVTIKGFIWNCCIVAWRMLDFGRVFLWLLLFYLIACYHKKIVIYVKDKGQGFLELCLLFFVPLLLYVPIIAARETPILHRYLMVYYLLFGLICLYFFPIIQSKTKQYVLFIFLCIILLSGHLWVYPTHIAKGWDANLACLPYFSLKKQMDDFIIQQNIPLEQIGSEFPMVASEKFTHLTKQTTKFIDKDQRNFEDFEYILYSNVSNDFTPKQLQQLDNQWILLKEYRKNVLGKKDLTILYLQLYRKK